jgi:hypothetical protein
MLREVVIVTTFGGVAYHQFEGKTTPHPHEERSAPHPISTWKSQGTATTTPNPAEATRVSFWGKTE